MKSLPSLDKNHPSFGTERATFLFALSVRDGEPRRFISVDATNANAVACIEYVIQPDQMASEKCSLIAVFRGVTSVGVRDDLMTEIPYVDFMVDILSSKRLLSDPSITTLFSMSLTGNQKLECERKLSEMQSEVETIIPHQLPVEKAPKVSDVVVQGNDERLLMGLCGLGFRKSEVQNYIRKLSQTNTQSIELLIRDGIRSLSQTPGARA